MGVTYTQVASAAINTDGDSSGWDDYDINTNQGVPTGAVVEIIATNPYDIGGLWIGVRTDGSGEDRRFYLHEAEDYGAVTARFLATVAGNGNIEIYDDDPTTYYLVGYWQGVTFTEGDVTNWQITVDSKGDGQWTNIDLDNFTGVANRVHLISLYTQKSNAARFLGVRDTTQSYDRRVDVHEAENPSLAGNIISMFVKSDANNQIEIYLEEYDENWAYVQGWFDADTDFHEDWFQLVADQTWVDNDLSAQLDKDGRVCDFLCAHDYDLVEIYIGVRQNGTAIDRTIEEHEAESNPYTGFGMTAQTDSGGIVECYAPPVYDYFWFGGYFFGTGFPPAGEAHQENPKEGITLDSSFYSVYSGYRSFSEGISLEDFILTIGSIVRYYMEELQTSDFIGTFKQVIQVLLESLSLEDSLSYISNIIRRYIEALELSSTIASSTDYIRSFIDSLQVGELVVRIKDGIQKIYESLQLSDHFLSITGFIRTSFEGLSLEDILTRRADRVLEKIEEVSLSDISAHISSFKRRYIDDIGLSEFLLTKWSLTRSLLELTSLTDIPYKASNIVRSLFEDLSFWETVDAKIFLLTQELYEFFQVLTDVSHITSWSRRVSDNITLSDSFTRISNFVRQFYDNLQLDDIFNSFKSIILGLSEALQIDDIVGTITAWIRSFNEQTTISDFLNYMSATIRDLYDSLTMSDILSTTRAWIRSFIDQLSLFDILQTIRGYVRWYTEDFNVSDIFSRSLSFIRRYTESLTVDDIMSSTKAIILSLLDTLSIDSFVSSIRNWRRDFTESLSVSDSFTRIWNTLRRLLEPLSLDDIFSKQYQPYTPIKVVKWLIRLLFTEGDD